MVAAVRRVHQSSYCACCNRHFSSLETPRGSTRMSAYGIAFRKGTEQVVCNENVCEPNWNPSVRPDVRLATFVHYITCHSCNTLHRNPPYEYLYMEERTNDVLVYGALLRLMGDMFKHRHDPDHH